jgi:antitoxin component YwqK of YwqJK toxin-antitoxin module
MKFTSFNTLLFCFFVIASITVQSQVVLTSHNNGSTHILGSSMDKDKQGKWIELSPKGDTLAIMHFQNNQMDGAFMFTKNAMVLNPNEILTKENIKYSHLFEIDNKAIGTFNENILQGEYTVYTVAGKIGSVTNYNKGKVNGLRKSYYINGAIAFEENYINDQLHGDWREYHKDGKIREERTYDKNVQLSSKYYEWTDSILKKTINYGFVTHEDNRIQKVAHGKTIQYYENGNVLSISNHEYGLPDGIWIGYYKSGNLKYKMIYENKIYKSYEKFEDQ